LEDLSDSTYLDFQVYNQTLPKFENLCFKIYGGNAIKLNTIYCFFGTASKVACRSLAFCLINIVDETTVFF